MKLYAISISGAKNTWSKQFLTDKEVLEYLKQGFIVKITNCQKED